MEDCSICCDSLNTSTGFCTLSCSHSFHIHCLTRWSTQTASCPLCRHTLSSTEAPARAPRTRTDIRYLLAERVEGIYTHWFPEVGNIVLEAPPPKRYRIGDGLYTDEEDIRHMMDIAGVSRPDAFRALKRHKGDIVEALVEIDSPPAPTLPPRPRDPMSEPSIEQTITTALQRMFDPDYTAYKWNSHWDLYGRVYQNTHSEENYVHACFQELCRADEDKLEAGYASM